MDYTSGMKPFDETKQQVLDIYAQMDKESLAFKAKSKIGCRPGCGECCKNPNIYASPVEMIPAALKLIKDNRAEEFIKEGQFNKTCHFFNGQCTAYGERPVVCRLFGWCSVASKTGELRISLCKVIKEDNKELVTELESGSLGNAPDIKNWAEKVRQLDPTLSEPLPINQALHIALEKILFYKSFE